MALGKAIAGAVRSVYIHARLTEERLRSGEAWWPLAPSFVADPYPVYRRLRERDPVHYSILTEQFVVSRFSDVDRILRDHRNFSNDLQRARSSRGSLGTRKKLKPSMLVQDPPDHTRLRRLVSRAFTPRSVAKMEDYIRATAHGLLDEVEGAGEFDLMKAFAVPLPTIVIARMIGVPKQDLDRFKVWSDHLARALEPLLTPEEVELVHQSDQQLAEYFRAIIEQRRREPRDDLVSRLAEAEDEGDKLTPDETIVMLRLLLTAGNETTTNLIGNGFRALLRYPDQLTLLRERPEMAAPAVEELLRYDSPVQLDMRITTRSGSSAPMNSTSRGPTRGTSRSGAGFTTALEHPWPGWRDELRSRCCWSGSTGSGSVRARRGTGPVSCFEGLSISTFGWRDGPLDTRVPVAEGELPRLTALAICMAGLIWFYHVRCRVPVPAANEREPMKTTINVNDQLLLQAKQRAANRGITLTRFIEDALRAKLMDGDRDLPAFKLQLKTVHGHAPPNVDVSDREALYDVLDRP